MSHKRSVESLVITGIFAHRGYQRLLSVFISLSLLLTVTACNKTPTVTPTPSQGIIATFMVSFTIGQVVEEDGCLKIVSKANTKNTLVFPADASATIAGDQVTIVTGLVTGDREENIFKFGDWAYIGGGELSILGEELLNTLPSKCQVPPYWVVGHRVRPTPPP